jgi:hypothetical protein
MPLNVSRWLLDTYGFVVTVVSVKRAHLLAVLPIWLRFSVVIMGLDEQR